MTAGRDALLISERDNVAVALRDLAAGTVVGGTALTSDVPLGHKDAAYVRSHFDTIEVGINDAPKPDEIMFILAMGTGPRVHDRAGGLKASEIKGEDGQR